MNEAMPTGRERPGEHWNARIIREEAKRLGNPPPEQDLSEAERLGLDLLMHGNAYVVDGKRVPPESVVAYRERRGHDVSHDCREHRVTALDGEGNSLGYIHCGICGRETKGYPLHADQFSQDMLAETFAGLLDEALHLEACWISEDETRCQCIIAKLQDALPRCGHVERIGTKGLTRQCLSTVHPSAPYKHTFGTV